MFSVVWANVLSSWGNVEHVDEDVMRIGYGPGSVDLRSYDSQKARHAKEGANLSAPNTVPKRITWTMKSIERSDAWDFNFARSYSLKERY